MSNDHPPYRIRIDSIDYHVQFDELSGRQLRELLTPPIPLTNDLFEELPNGEDRQIDSSYQAEIYTGKVFYTAPHHKKYRIYVNGVEKIVETKLLSYDDVVGLAFPARTPDTIYSVTFEKAKKPHEGDLVQSQSVEIKDGAEFDVDDTGRS